MKKERYVTIDGAWFATQTRYAFLKFFFPLTFLALLIVKGPLVATTYAKKQAKTLWG